MIQRATLEVSPTAVSVSEELLVLLPVAELPDPLVLPEVLAPAAMLPDPLVLLEACQSL